MDGYAGYNRLIAPERGGPDIQLAYCWAHARRKLVGSSATGQHRLPSMALSGSANYIASEAELRGLDPQARLARQQERSAPLVADMQLSTFVGYKTFADVAKRLPTFIEEIYNAVRLHSALGYKSPIELKPNSPTGGLV